LYAELNPRSNLRQNPRPSLKFILDASSIPSDAENCVQMQ
jgi:hypothetical protein